MAQDTLRVMKIGGNELDNPDFLAGLAQAVAFLEGPCLIVHGGGKGIAALQSRLGLQEIKVDGLRVTDAESLQVVEMALSGSANKVLVRALLAAGVMAAGISGVDGGLLRCNKLQHPSADLGFVGEIVAVNGAVIEALLAAGITPVVSPISLGLDGQTYNVNGDQAATGIAAALGAVTLDFVSNVPGVLQDGNVLPHLTISGSEALIDSGVIHSGMVPKVRAAVEAVRRGVPQARIVDLAGLQNGGGTTFAAQI
jgi:acetylglutamate kinase